MPCIHPVPNPILRPIGDPYVYSGLYHNPSPVASFPTVPVKAIVPSQSEPRRVPATLEDFRQPSLSWPLDHHSGHSNWSHPISSLPFNPTPIHCVTSTIEGIPSLSVDPRDTPANVDSLPEFPHTALASVPYHTPTVVPYLSLSATHPTALEASQWTNPNQAFPTLLSTEPVPTISYPCSPLLPPGPPPLYDPSPLTLPSPAPAPAPVPVPESMMGYTTSCPRGSRAAVPARTTDTDADADADTDIMGGMTGIGIEAPLPPVSGLPSGFLDSDIIRPTPPHQDTGASLIGRHLSAPFVIDRKDMDHEVYPEVSVAVLQDTPHTSEGYILARQSTGPPPIPPRTSIVPSQAPLTARETVVTSNPSRYFDLNTVFSFHPPPFDGIATPVSTHSHYPGPYPHSYPYPYPHSQISTASLPPGPKAPTKPSHQTTTKSKPRRPTRPKRGTLPLFRLARQYGSLTLPSPFGPRPNSNSSSNPDSNSDPLVGGLPTSTARSQGERAKPPSLAEQIESMIRGPRRVRKTTPPRVEGWVPPDQRPLPPKQPVANEGAGQYCITATAEENFFPSSSTNTVHQVADASRTPPQILSGPLRATLVGSPLTNAVAAATTAETATHSAPLETPTRSSKKRARLGVPSSPPCVGSLSVARTPSSAIPRSPQMLYPGVRPSLVVPSQALDLLSDSGLGPSTTTTPVAAALCVPTLPAFIGSASPVNLPPNGRQVVSHPQLDSASQKVRTDTVASFPSPPGHWSTCSMAAWGGGCR